MKPDSNPVEPAVEEPAEDAIREIAYHMFLQGDGAHGHDLEHWFEAKALLTASEHLARKRAPRRQAENQVAATANEIGRGCDPMASKADFTFRVECWLLQLAPPD